MVRILNLHPGYLASRGKVRLAAPLGLLWMPVEYTDDKYCELKLGEWKKKEIVRFQA